MICYKTINIVVTGPESVGKSTLTSQLSRFYNCQMVEEHARSYITNLGRHYTFDDVENIARHQYEQYLLHNCNDGRMVIYDTYLLVTKVWFFHVYQSVPQWLDTAIRESNIDLFLLCKPDLPWVDDGIRENETLRDYLFELYLAELKHYQFNYKIVEGEGEERLSQAKAHINNYFNTLIQVV